MTFSAAPHRQSFSRAGGHRRTTRAAVLLLVVAVLSGCSITAKRDAARAVAAAQKELYNSGTALLSITVQPELPHGYSAQSGARGLKAGPLGPPRTKTVVLNFPEGQALVIAPTGTSPKPGPVQYYDDGVIYQRLANAAASSRPWLRLDYRRLYDNRKSQKGIGFGSDLLSPLWITDLLKGTLTGSIHRVGTVQVAGAPATEYKANFAWDKCLKGTSDSHKRAVEAAMTLLGIPDKVVHGRIWLNSTGAIRQMEALVRENKGRHQAVNWRYTIHLTSIGQPVPIVLPKASEVARVDALPQIISAQAPSVVAAAAAS